MASFAGARTRVHSGQANPKLLSNPNTAHSNGFRVGGVSVGIDGQRSDDVVLAPSLQPFQIQADAFDVNIQIEWADRLSSSTRMPLFDSGAIWRLYEDAARFRFDFESPSFGDQPYKRLFVDAAFRQATLQMSEESFASFPQAVALEYPLDELLIMHRLTQEKAIELHGVGIVGPDGASNLFVGHSGAGKSTTARLWTSLHDVEILSDDRIIVREHPHHKDDSRDDATQIYMYGTPWHGEAHFALPQRAPLHRIFVLEHGHGNVITRLSRSQAVAELFARAFVPFHRHEYLDSALIFLERVAESVPCYHYSFEPDRRAVDRIFHFSD
jgi:hypothetical protein